MLFFLPRTQFLNLGSWMSLRMYVGLLEVHTKFFINLHMYIILGRRHIGFTRLTKGAVIQVCFKKYSLSPLLLF